MNVTLTRTLVSVAVFGPVEYVVREGVTYHGSRGTKIFRKREIF